MSLLRISSQHSLIHLNEWRIHWSKLINWHGEVKRMEPKMNRNKAIEAIEGWTKFLWTTKQLTSLWCHNGKNYTRKVGQIKLTRGQYHGTSRISNLVLFVVLAWYSPLLNLWIPCFVLDGFVWLPVLLNKSKNTTFRESQESNLRKLGEKH